MNPGTPFGPYTLQRLLGGGGMADVYLALDTANRWPVALKVLRASAADNTRLLKRFEREAKVLMGLRHSHIVQIYNAGATPEGRTYIAMEYVGGGDLARLMEHKPRLPVAEAVYLMRRVAGAMAYAHDAGIIHRDLKPSNILLRADNGEPVVTDLGIAAIAGNTGSRLTGTMEALGTPQYMAPEQASNHASVDGRADIYAIGVMLYELLTGRLPFNGDNPWAILIQKQQEAAPPVLSVRRDLNSRLAAVVDTCLQRDPAARYQTAGSLAAALDAFLPTDARPPAPLSMKKSKAATTPGGSPITGPDATPSNLPGTPIPTGMANKRRSPPLLWAGAGALALLLLLALVIPGFGRGGGGGSEPTDAPEIAALLDPTQPAEPAAAPGESTSTPAAVMGQLTDTPTATKLPATSTVSAAVGQEVITATEMVEMATAIPVPSEASTSQPAATQGTTVRITRDVYTRSGPGLTYPMAGNGLGGGEEVAVLGRDTRGDWYLVESLSGPVWVPKGFVTPISGSLDSVSVAATIPAPPTNTPTATPTEEPDTTVMIAQITLLHPRAAACPPSSSAPSYKASNTLDFQWTWSGTVPQGGYFEVRVGAVGNIVSQGRADPALHFNGNRWSYPVSGPAMYIPGNGAYQWAVYVMDGDGRPVANSMVSCFGLIGSDSTSSTEPVPTSSPPLNSTAAPAPGDND